MNASIKCPQCGLINWADAESCKRCLAPLGHNQSQASSVNDEATTSFGYSGFNPAHQPLDDMSYPSYSSYVPARSGNEIEMATRGSRLSANLINVLCMLPIFLLAVLAVLTGDSRNGNSGAAVAVLAVLMILYMVGLICVQLFYLTTRGQTIGKKAMGIRIVKLETYENGGFITNVILREGLTLLVSNIPLVGSIFGITDVLFIFREDQRCIHDLIAGTIVVKA